MRSLWACRVLLLLAAAGLPSPVPAGPPLNDACTSETSGGDVRTVRCVLAPEAAPRTLRFTARFSGGHDDTRASIAARLQDAPLPCAEGSKTSLFGEDGDVSLACRFAVPGGAVAARVEVEVQWSHAQYTGFVLEAD